MGNTYEVYGKKITVTDEAQKLAIMCTGGPLTQVEIENYIDIRYGDDVIRGTKGISLEEAIKTHSTEELNKVVNDSIFEEFKDYE